MRTRSLHVKCGTRHSPRGAVLSSPSSSKTIWTSVHAAQAPLPLPCSPPTQPLWHSHSWPTSSLNHLHPLLRDMLTTTPPPVCAAALHRKTCPATPPSIVRYTPQEPRLLVAWEEPPWPAHSLIRAITRVPPHCSTPGLASTPPVHRITLNSSMWAPRRTTTALALQDPFTPSSRTWSSR